MDKSILGQPGLTAIPEVWDIPCPVVPACLPREDIDETPSAEKLCVEWQPVMGRINRDTGHLIRRRTGESLATDR